MKVTVKKNGAVVPATTTARPAGKSSSASWMQKGAVGEAHAEKLHNELQARMEATKNQLHRLWNAVGNSALVTVVEAEPIFIYEHDLMLNGQFRNYFTCRESLDECPLCDSGSKPYYLCLYTIINHTGFTTKKGEVLKHLKQVLAMKNTALQKFKRRRAELDGSVKLVQFKFTRDTRDEASTGTDISVVKRWEGKDLIAYLRGDGVSSEDIKKLITPYDFETLLAPKSIEDLRKIVGERPIGSGEDDASEPVVTDAVDEDDLLSQLSS